MPTVSPDPHQLNPNDTRGRVAFPALLALLYLMIVLPLAWYKLLWGDEFFTYWVGQTRSLHGIWQALKDGADPNPPLMHVLDWASTSLFGGRALAIRLPSITGVGLALVCLWMLLRRHVAPVYAAAGCLALMATRGFDYAYDARSYGLLQGFAMTALLAWDAASATTEARRQAWLVALAVALAAGVSSNYYGVLMFAPISAGELWLLANRRRWRSGVWLAMLAGAMPLLAYRRLIAGDITRYAPHAWNKPQPSMMAASYLLLVEGVLWPMLALAALWGWRRRGNLLRDLAVPAQVVVAVGVLLLYPVLGYGMAVAGGGMISPRCVIPVCGGVALAVALLLERLVSRRAALGCVAFLVLWVGLREAVCLRLLRQQRHAFVRLCHVVDRSVAPGETVLVGDPVVLMPLYWYGSAGLRQQLDFPIDFDVIHRVEADDSNQQNFWAGRTGVFPMRIGTPDELLPVGVESVYIGSPTGWLAQRLQRDGATLLPVDVPGMQDGIVPWGQLGGVFTTMASYGTGIYFVVPVQKATPVAAVPATMGVRAP